MAQKEIGFAPLSLTAEGLQSALAEVGNQPVLHWHGDQFYLPVGVKSLATTPLCPNQAFQVEHHAMAWQFHLEVDATRIEQWLIGHTAELSQCGITTSSLRLDAAKHNVALKDALHRVTNQWLAAAPL